MKKTRKFLRLSVILLTIVFVLGGCDDLFVLEPPALIGTLTIDNTSPKVGDMPRIYHPSHDIDDLIALNGQRIPSAADSQKSFKVLTVFVSADNSPDVNYQLVAGDIKWFANMPGYEYKQGLYNFSQATGGIGSLEVKDLKDSLK